LKLFAKTLAQASLVVMEATGYYHYRLAQFLYKNGETVSVVNPFVGQALHSDKTGQGKDR
jgi:transposase